jgi:DNA-3-methyladenine glycosylase I
MTLTRCPWVGTDPLMIAYHDKEWGVPVHDDKALFAKLMLDCMQAGLSWSTILKKRDNYVALFDDLDPYIVQHYDAQKIESLLQNPGIIRNRLKVNAIIQNAKIFVRITKNQGSFATYLWSFVGHTTIVHSIKALSDYPTTNSESIAMSKALKKQGMTFVGPTICYAFMQAVGMINDHAVDCFRYSHAC